MHVVVTIKITTPNSFFNHDHIHGYFKAFTITITIVRDRARDRDCDDHAGH